MNKDMMEGYLINKIFKDKFWYNKYNIKLETSIRYTMGESTSEVKKRSNDFYEFVNNTVSDCHWYSNQIHIHPHP